jgi:preprotein translocase subunit YajC
MPGCGNEWRRYNVWRFATRERFWLMAEFGFLLVIMLLLMGGYWSFFVYPRQREFNKRQEYVRSLATGDEVVTFGGMLGRVVDIDGDTGIVYVEIAEGVVVRFVAASIVSAYDAERVAADATRGLRQFETGKDDAD